MSVAALLILCGQWSLILVVWVDTDLCAGYEGVTCNVCIDKFYRLGDEVGLQNFLFPAPLRLGLVKPRPPWCALLAVGIQCSNSSTSTVAHVVYLVTFVAWQCRECPKTAYIILVAYGAAFGACVC